MLKQVQNQLDKIEKLLTVQIQNQTEFLDMKEASDFLKLKKSTLYQLVFKKVVPHHKCTKKTLFKKSELVSWVENFRVNTIQELEQQMKQTIN